jgi:hypothetical protein
MQISFRARATPISRKERLTVGTRGVEGAPVNQLSEEAKTMLVQSVIIIRKSRAEIEERALKKGFDLRRQTKYQSNDRS